MGGSMITRDDFIAVGEFLAYAVSGIAPADCDIRLAGMQRRKKKGRLDEPAPVTGFCPGAQPT
jgi:hypothetical protein